MIALRLASFFPLALITMPSSTAAKKSKKKGGGVVIFFRDLIERPKSANASASQPNSTRVSVSSVSGVHDLVPGNDAGTAEPTASGKFIGSISMLLTTTQPLSRWQCHLASGYVLSTVLDSFFADLADSAHSPDPTAPSVLARPPLSSVPHLLGSTVGQGEIRYAESFRLMRLTSDTSRRRQP